MISHSTATLTALCATGCMARDGHHTPDCASKHCRGCLNPRYAEYGTLCAWCWVRLNSDIAEIPELIAHLRHIGEPHAHTPPPSDTRTYTDPAFSTVLPAAWLAADELGRLLDSWVDNVLDAHPERLHGPAPGQEPAAWLSPHLPWVAGQDWAPEMREEITREVSTMKARWPTADMVERERDIPDIRCPRCDQVSLTYAPPAWFRQPFKVSCSNPDCARVFSEDEWERLVGLLELAQRRSS